MPADARLQGSCCAPMDEARYFQQIKGIRKYADISEVPPDPYDIPAGMAQKLMPYYNLRLNRTEKIAYDGAFRPAGSMLLQVLAVAGKFLIHEHQFTGQQLVDLWNIAQGCGGPSGTIMH